MNGLILFLEVNKKAMRQKKLKICLISNLMKILKKLIIKKINLKKFINVEWLNLELLLIRFLKMIQAKD